MKLPFTLRAKAEAQIAKVKQKLVEAKDAANKKLAEVQAKARAKADRYEQRVAKHEAEIERLRIVISTMEGAASDQDQSRQVLALRLSGEGIEVGALDHPLKVRAGVKVRYVDLLTREQNLLRFPTLDAETLVETDYICDGQTLSVIPDASQDFVIANHMLEHCINPLKAVETFLRVLKPEGRLFIALPDKRFTFDFKRKITPWEHVKHDFLTNRTMEDREVYEEYRDCVDPHLDVDVYMQQQVEIHHHAWTQSEIMEMFINARRELGMLLEIEMMAKRGNEVILLMQKSDPPHEDHTVKHAKALAALEALNASHSK